ncbi:MAG TPA: 2-succinyl-5-enolpyruvyl-6-hydroxy-3-cyclohexene-1-carboxylic-acid synthase [Baekduia sp.]|uniref:2-succinyl-5-enolpyruvyl-6-hydroxy-3- cyclohexene-1-carboxylic-acid synthase n=1 Tax=Baekduia sp. TaxID=2600305 RepID=UPI002D7865C3|nr:2-succinyl-5-enolpyruvyl-6-hydroxy-3-cyclohexene-1-carboxylic-acid synthase [Baekduia sp.]HET6505972.1 2-succinyl-5-enolpyruvyl-6-hydroxy-3-cyclohexene-1-carboxylic-acid synthase [Baekduia sp.]
MSETRDTYLLLRAFADELHRCGVAGACTSPGSRSTPLVLTLARDGRIPVTSHVDERSAAFFALGLAQATGRPAVLACTSGTAAANYVPAVIEAAEAGVPLIVLTTDRPPELRDVGAGQTIDQIKLYGDNVKWFFELGTHEATPRRLRWIRQLACRVHGAARQGRPGVVHVNLPLREPLVLDAPLEGSPSDGGRPDGAPWTAFVGAAPDDVAALRGWLRAAGPRGLIVAGRDADGPATAALGERLRWPVLADPLSGARTGDAAIAHYDALLRTTLEPGATPSAVLRVGDLPTSKPLRAWLAGLGDDVPQAALTGGGDWPDPDAVISAAFALAPGALARIGEPEATDPDWTARWREADARAAAAIAATIGDDALNEPRIARELATAVPTGAVVVIAASMPIRDVETFWPVLDTPPRALANRGANGIDGTISTAYGIADADRARPTYLLIGDVALAHDVGGLLAGRRLGVPLTIVCVDNAGGGIFDFLPVSTQGAEYEEHVLTPTGLDVARAAALYDARYVAAEDLATLREALQTPPDGTTIVHVRTERAANVALHRAVWEAVSAAHDESLRPDR